MSVHFSSGADHWATPDDLFAELNREFGFTVDVCALPESAKCERYFIPPLVAEYHILWPGTPTLDGLAQDWSREVFWMNPPYSKLRVWMAKATAEHARGARGVALIPSRTDTQAWHRNVWDKVLHQPRPGIEVRFIEGRLIFRGAEHPAPFPSALVIFKNHPKLG